MATSKTDKTKAQKVIGSVSRFTPRQFRHVTEEMYRRNLELNQINKTLSLLRTIDLIVLHQPDTLQTIATEISTAIVREYQECALAAVYSHLAPRDGKLILLGQAYTKMLALPEGKVAADAFLQDAVISYDEIDPQGTFFNIEKHAAKIANSLGSDVPSLQAFAASIYTKDFYFAPLLASGGSVGMLVVGLHEKSDENTQTLLDRVREAVSKAVENKALQDENRRILHKLQTTNEKLKALDETKDDFISMASHQLRTPLTSVKGYLSMVLDGDAGKLTKTERQMLTQAFISSQRMVYLISDLLNVSRLRTGKFVIETAPISLADIISDEIAQLREAAATRDLNLLYDKPKDFPMLLLDETKTRQVIMNFIDNAIYYTTAGGHIRIELIEKPSSIELKVTDDGIGVPRSEQHHLFTKFYRAGNARKARPDGTGLGLFMAKKVVIAQGGAILFQSEEGKGSSFGFSFPKSKLAPTTPEAKSLKKSSKKK